MIIVVVQHDVGGKFHVAIVRDTFTVGRGRDNDIVVDVPDPRTIAARDAGEPIRVGEYTLAFELHPDPLETTLLIGAARGDDASRAVYADWLDQRGLATHAAFLRNQLAILHHAWDSPEFAATSAELRALAAQLPYGWRSYLDRPVIELGDPARLAFRLGLANTAQPTDRVVQMWAAGIELTCDDDRVYVPAYAHALEREIERVPRRRELDGDPVTMHRWLDGGESLYDRYTWFSCGPTSDNIITFLFRDGDDAVITFAFWRPEHPRPGERGQVFVTRLPERELLDLLGTLVAVLKSGT